LVAGFRVVRMKSRGQQPVHAMNGFRFGVGADLQLLVVIGFWCRVLFHWLRPTGRPTAYRRETVLATWSAALDDDWGREFRKPHALPALVVEIARIEPSAK